MSKDVRILRPMQLPESWTITLGLHSRNVSSLTTPNAQWEKTGLVHRFREYGRVAVVDRYSPPPSTAAIARAVAAVVLQLPALSVDVVVVASK